MVPPSRAYLASREEHLLKGLRLLRDPVAQRVLWTFGAANCTGAVVVYLYLLFAGKDSGEVVEDLTWGPKLLAVYLLVSGIVGFITGVRALCALEWWVDGRAPTSDERLATLLLPRRFMVLSLIAWTGGNLTFAIATTVSGGFAREIVRSVVGAGLGAMTTAAACSLVIDRQLRPVFAAALRRGPMPTVALGVRQRIVLAWALGSGIPLLGIVTAPIGPDDARVRDLAILGGIGLVAGGTLLSIATRSVSDRLAAVRKALASVRAGDLDVDVSVDEAGEVGTLQAGVNEMVRGLRERQVLADLFGRHVGSEVARQALEEGVHLGGEQRDVSVLFLDVTGSTWLAATRPATEVVAMLNRLFTVVVRVVGEEGGWVDKFEGDAAMCVFGAPAPLADHATHALRAARRLRAAVDIDLGIGVSTGTVVAGNIGSESRFEYTVIGDPVNEASRLTEAAKARPGRVLAACRSVERAAPVERDCWSPAETMLLRGRPEPTTTCEPRLSAT